MIVHKKVPLSDITSFILFVYLFLKKVRLILAFLAFKCSSGCIQSTQHFTPAKEQKNVSLNCKVIISSCLETDRKIVFEAVSAFSETRTSTNDSPLRDMTNYK